MNIHFYHIVDLITPEFTAINSPLRHHSGHSRRSDNMISLCQLRTIITTSKISLKYRHWFIIPDTKFIRIKNPNRLLSNLFYSLYLHSRKPKCGACIIEDLCEFKDKTEI